MGRRVPATRTPPLEVVTLAPLVLAQQLQPVVLDHPHRAAQATRATPATIVLPTAAMLAMATPTPPLEVVTLAPLVLARQPQRRVLDHPHRAAQATLATPATMVLPTAGTLAMETRVIPAAVEIPVAAPTLAMGTRVKMERASSTE